MDEIRKEYKFKVTSLELSKFMERFYLRLNKLHPDRQITSLYMDTHDFYIYNSSNTYDSEKFKFRFRKYSNNKTIYREIKYNTKEGKRKSVKATKIKNFSDIKYADFESFKLLPAAFIQYNRSYYQFYESRITLDQEIVFLPTPQRTKIKSVIKPPFKIIEYKILEKVNLDIEKNFFKNPVRFSKYNSAIESLYNLSNLDI